MTPEELVRAAIKNSDAGSARQLARKLELHPSRLTMWSNETRELHFEDAMLLAEAANLPPVKTAAEIRSAKSQNKKILALLKKLSKTAALVGLGLAHYTGANCAEVHKYKNTQFDINTTDYTFTQIILAAQQGETPCPADPGRFRRRCLGTDQDVCATACTSCARRRTATETIG